MNKNNKNIQEQ